MNLAVLPPWLRGWGEHWSSACPGGDAHRIQRGRRHRAPRWFSWKREKGAKIPGLSKPYQGLQTTATTKPDGPSVKPPCKVITGHTPSNGRWRVWGQIPRWEWLCLNIAAELLRLCSSWEFWWWGEGHFSCQTAYKQRTAISFSWFRIPIMYSNSLFPWVRFKWLPVECSQTEENLEAI